MASREESNIKVQNQSYLNDSGNLRVPTPTRSSKPEEFVFKICENGDPKMYSILNIWSSKTVEQLVKSTAVRLEISEPLEEFYLAIYDNEVGKWRKLANSNSSITLEQLDLERGSLLTIKKISEQKATDRNAPRPTSSLKENSLLRLKLCKEPMNRIGHVEIKINSSSTLGELRKQAYDYFKISPKNRPIYGWFSESWMKFDSDLDHLTLKRLKFESHTFISIDIEERTMKSKNPSGLCGLINLGNTCFMNSVFQCLSNIPKFTDKVLELHDEIDAPIIDGYKQLLKNLWSGSTSAIKPYPLITTIIEHFPCYTIGKQHDAQEFMNRFLNLIHSEFSLKQTLITEIFFGQLQSTVRCLACRNPETTNEPFSFLPISISSRDQLSVLYVKTDGEQFVFSIKVDSSITTINDLIDCFIKQYDPKLKKEQIQAVQLSGNIVTSCYDHKKSLRTIRKTELAFVEKLEDIVNYKHIWCEFVDYSTDTTFRPPIYLHCPATNCCYEHLSDQIEQLLGHISSITNAPISAFQYRWMNKNGRCHRLKTNVRSDERLPNLDSFEIIMDSYWVDIYQQHQVFNHSNSILMLTDLLADFFREDYLDGDYHCLNCSKSTRAQQKSDLCLPLPHALIIQLKRFSYGVDLNDKIDTFVSFPLRELDVKNYIIHDSLNPAEITISTKYDLVAVSNHSGGLKCGHYTTYAKNVQDDNWYLFDDAFVRPVSSDKVVTENAYILVYVQKTE